jgi:hypothetical protein
MELDEPARRTPGCGDDREQHMSAKATIKGAAPDLYAMPDPNDLLDIYFASWSPGEPAPCVHFQGAVYQQFRGCDTVEKLRRIVDQLAHQRTDVQILTASRSSPVRPTTIRGTS